MSLFEGVTSLKYFCSVTLKTIMLKVMHGHIHTSEFLKELKRSNGFGEMNLADFYMICQFFILKTRPDIDI